MLELRRARLDDAHVLTLIAEAQEYYIALYGGPDDDPLDPVAFAPPRGGFLLGHLGDRPIAMGGWTRVAPHDPRATVRRMYVTSDQRRHGHAAALLAAIEDDARSAGVTELIFTTGRPQTAAVAFYRARRLRRHPGLRPLRRPARCGVPRQVASLNPGARMHTERRQS